MELFFSSPPFCDEQSDGVQLGDMLFRWSSGVSSANNSWRQKLRLCRSIFPERAAEEASPAATGKSYLFFFGLENDVEAAF